MTRAPAPEDQVPTADHTLHAGLRCHVFVGDAGQLVELPLAGSLVVGRGSEADLRVVAEGVSRKHALLEIAKDGITLRDLGSKNGTHVNGARLAGPRVVGAGDEIRVGEARLVLSRRAASEASPALLLPAALAARLRIDIARANAFEKPLALVRAVLEGGSWLALQPTRALAAELQPHDLVGIEDDATLVCALPGKTAADARAVEAALARLASEHNLRCSVATLAADTAASAKGAGRQAISAAPRVQAAAAASLTPVLVDPAMRALYEQLERVATSPVSVLITGETGVGKELVASALHRASGRRGRLVGVNAAALPEALLESELFGHERGAFTGATTTKVGLFEVAHQGTLFLDEVGDLPPATQVKLLRILEDGVVRRIGGTVEKRVDVRVVAATNVDLVKASEERRFRQDLLFRLNACTFRVPPLRDRPADLRPLAAHFLARVASPRPLTFSAAALARLEAYPWPGNVRELRNVVERAALLCDAPDGVIGPEQLPPELHPGERQAAGVPASTLAGPISVRSEVHELERERIGQALAAADGNLTRAAELLGLPRKTLAYRLEKLGLRTRGG